MFHCLQMFVFWSDCVLLQRNAGLSFLGGIKFSAGYPTNVMIGALASLN